MLRRMAKSHRHHRAAILVIARQACRPWQKPHSRKMIFFRAGAGSRGAEFVPLDMIVPPPSGIITVQDFWFNPRFGVYGRPPSRVMSRIRALHELSRKRFVGRGRDKLGF